MAIKKEQLLEYQKLQQEFTANPDGYAGSLTELFTALIELKDEKTSCELLRRPDAFTKEQLEELTAYLKKKRGFSDVKAELEKLVSLTALTIEKGCLKAIAPGTYKELILPEGIKKIDKNAFSGAKVKKLVIPSSVKKLLQQNFKGNASLQEVIISEGTEVIGKEAFFGCKGLKSIVIPETVTEIGAKAFRECKKLTEINIPEHVETIGEKAFQDCTALKSFTMHGASGFFPANAFEGCENLETISLPESENNVMYEGVVYDKELTKLVFLPDKIKDLILPETVSCVYIERNLHSVTFHPGQQVRFFSNTVRAYYPNYLHLVTEKRTYTVNVPIKAVRYASDSSHFGFNSKERNRMIHTLTENCIEVMQGSDIPEDFQTVSLYDFYNSCSYEYTAPMLDTCFQLAEILGDVYHKDKLKICKEQADFLLKKEMLDYDETFIENPENLKYISCLEDYPETMTEVFKSVIECEEVTDSDIVKIFQKALDEGYINESNINEIIMLANQCQQYELQVFLTNYSYEHFPAVDVLKKFSL